MNQERTIIGAHGFFYKSGAAFTVPSAGVVSKTAKPAYNDPGWYDLGVGDWTPQPKGKNVPFMAPAPGARRLMDEIETERGITWKGKIMEMSNIVWQLILAAQDLPMAGAGGQYNPLGGSHIIRGWLKLQQYNQRDELINTMDIWTGMKVTGDTAMGDQPVDVDVEAPIYFSTLNTGNLT